MLFLDIVVCFGGRVGEGSLKKKRPASRTTKWTYPEEVVTELTNLMGYKISVPRRREKAKWNDKNRTGKLTLSQNS